MHFFDYIYFLIKEFYALSQYKSDNVEYTLLEDKLHVIDICSSGKVSHALSDFRMS